MTQMTSSTYLQTKQTSPSTRDLIKELKRRVFELEKENYDKLYIYHTSRDWWRMGGNSALFYHYEISKQLNVNSTLRLDNDYYYVWRTGVISIRQLDAFLQKISKAGLKYACKGNALIIVQLANKFTRDDVVRLSQIEQAKAEQFNKIVAPYHIMPRINTRLDQLAERIVNKALQLPRQRYDLYGARCANICLQMQEDFVTASNGQMSLDDYLNKALQQLDLLANRLVVAKKYNLLDNSAALDCARHIEYLRDNLPREVKRLQKKLAEQPTRKKPTAREDD